MKQLFAVAGLAVAGAALAAPSAVAQSDKPWSVGASLRGFYDDNYTTLPSAARVAGSPTKRSSFGFDIRPNVGYRIGLDQTSINARYEYGLKFYEDRRQNSADHSHDALISLTHSFSENCKISVKDNFVVAQDPGILDPGIAATSLRFNNSNWRNTAGFEVNGELGDNFGVDVSYSNSIFDYDADGTVGSISALLDRTEHLANADLRWKASTETTGIVGYQFGMREQNGNDLIAAGVSSKTRNTQSHYGYVGVDHSFSSELSVNLRGGVQYTRYPNALAGTKDTTTSPYVDVKGKWGYAQNCSLELGLRHDRNQTDIGGSQDQQATLVFASLNHALTEKISANLDARYQSSTFNQGPANNLSDNVFMLGVHLTYKINETYAFETGYMFDRLDSDLDNTGTPRSYTRNRVYLGVRAGF
ncbi:MAG: outer membrane beta-barrel protein [Verrucomicrobia bacterium]|nr:outer membrane beta-barrel protein [Verrucomicrobiota bacterium]